MPQPDPTGPNRNAFHADEHAQEAQSEEVLAAFHLERLRVYASDKETWHAVDTLAREVRAIQHSRMSLLQWSISRGRSAPSARLASFPRNAQRAVGG